MPASGAILAVDPGAVSGAVALSTPAGNLVVGDLAVVNRQIDPAAFSRVVRDMGVNTAVVEQVASMPKQGVASTWKFGFACGAIYGVLAACGVPVHYVTPSVWKRHHGLLGKDKEASRALAIKLHPGIEGLHLKKHQGRAEALLILDWFRNVKLKEQQP